MYSVFFAKEAKNAIRKLPTKIKQQIKASVLELAENPELGKKLTHELTGLRSMRSGNYRIIYEIQKKEIIVVVLTVGHRKDIYQKTKRKLK